MGAWIGLAKPSADGILTMEKLSSTASSDWSRIVSSFGDSTLPSGTLSPISSDLEMPGAPPPTPTEGAVFQWMDTKWWYTLATSFSYSWFRFIQKYELQRIQCDMYKIDGDETSTINNVITSSFWAQLGLVLLLTWVMVSWLDLSGIVEKCSVPDLPSPWYFWPDFLCIVWEWIIDIKT